MSGEKHKANYPLDIDSTIKELSKHHLEHSSISETCVALTNDGRVVIAEFSVHQEVDNGRIFHYWGWHELLGAKLNEQKDGITFDSAIGVDVINWQEINLV